ncbi:Imm61 family immunity protein [Agromyces aerolatus]|uniref:Imm61 family immunity protein n=1 Tax=Agromyces sp. LY-1074 TaxID=3074080 RepID=UPI0028587B0F|nr:MULTISPECIES: Imm61 family immunity protein [unclassified Agromyces]MDR5698417.1 Imm61 family immunity protein [Agromyces sp. LY-1074]MDR5704711.1 Imm61 family immunity protein [Agromyces sp. LY-1358]
MNAAAPGLDDPALIAFAEQGRMVPLPPRDGVLARFSDMELIDAVVERDGEYVLETSERGGRARPVISSPALAPVRRELVLRLGSAVRARLRLPRLDVSVDPAALPAGFELVEQPDAAELRWDEAGAPMVARFRSGQFAANDAVRFAQFARIPEAELMAAFLDPNARAVPPSVA